MRLMLHLITYIPKVVCLYFYEYAQALSSISIAQNLEITLCNSSVSPRDWTKQFSESLALAGVTE